MRISEFTKITKYEVYRSECRTKCRRKGSFFHFSRFGFGFLLPLANHAPFALELSKQGGSLRLPVDQMMARWR